MSKILSGVYKFELVRYMYMCIQIINLACDRYILHLRYIGKLLVDQGQGKYLLLRVQYIRIFHKER